MKPAPKIEEEGLIAVIVGIDGYKDRIFKSLHCAVNDAVYLTETLQKVWQGRKVHIKTLIWPSLNEEQAKTQRETWGIELPQNASEVTGDHVLSIVRECAGLVRESDTFIFYFSGHGVLDDEEPALVTVADGKTAEGIDYIKITEVQQAAAECVSQKKVMILDCCQKPADKHRPVEGYKNLKDLTQGWSILISSSPGEFSIEDEYFGDSRDGYLQQGIFTASLVEGLRGEALTIGNSVSLAELVHFVGKRVPIEYQERLLAKLTGKGDQNRIDSREMDFSSQNPVLLTDAVAIDGPYQIIMAPKHVPTSQKELKKKWPSKDFFTYWFKFILGKWPAIEFPHQLAFRLGGALLYTAIMMLTLLWQSSGITDNKMLIFISGVGLASALIWWTTLPMAVAANEDRWQIGGYVTAIFYLLWHCIVALGFAWICGIDQITSTGVNRIVYLVIDLFFILAVVVICGCNASQTIIALAETIRPGERREIRQAIRAFQQFKYTIVGVDLYNYVAMVSARPDFYFFVWVISILIIGFNIYEVTAAGNTEIAHLLVFLMRNICAALLVSWLVFWYHAAFKFIQREVYKR